VSRDDAVADDGSEADDGAMDGDDGSAAGDGDEESAAGGARPDSDRLLLDAMLGKLARYLRLCGYDAAYALDRGVEADDALREVAAAEGRTLLTRDRDLAARVDGAVRLTERDVLDQLRELEAAGFEIALAAEPARCGVCNGPVERAPVDGSFPAYVPDAAGTGELAVWRCRNCGQHFWKGGHWEDVRDRLDRL